MDVHQGQVSEGGAIVYDTDGTKPDPTKLREKVRLLGIPLRKKAQSLSPNALMRNTVALGAAVRLFDLDFRHVESAFKDIWGDKRSEEHTSELQSRLHLVCRLLLEKKKKKKKAEIRANQLI